MAWKCEYIQEVPLRPAGGPEEYELHTAALEWTLEEPIIIENEQDIKSRSTWKNRVEPFAHQVQNLITYCKRLLPVGLLADEVGLGKTISAALILSELMARKKVDRTLVVCPKILGPQWVEELDTKFAIVAKNVTGKELAQEIRRTTPVVITTYQGAAKQLGKLDKDAFDMLILDEAHKLRNLHSAKPPKMAASIHNALRNKLFKYVLMLTATPIQNSLIDLYSLIDCLTVGKSHANPLGTAKDFKKKYFLAADNPRALRPEHAEEFRAILRQYIVRIRRHETNLVFPERQVETRRVEATAVEKACEELVGAHVRRLNPLQQISLSQALFSSPQALAAQMQNMAQNQTIPAEAAAQARTLAERAENEGGSAKLRSLMRLVEELRRQRPADWRAVVFTLRKETQDAIGRSLKKSGIPHAFISGESGDANQSALESFREQPPRVNVLISTDAGSEGINLQVCNVLVNYDLPWNPMIVEQRIGRLQRLSAKHAFVVVWNLVVANSVEERIVSRLMEKLQVIAHSLGDIESILEAAHMEDEDDKSFEQQIRDMVVQSLLGQDVKSQQHKIEQSIEKAKNIMKSERAEIDRVLGSLTELHKTGPRIGIEPRKPPHIKADDFVIRAKRASGARVEPISDFLFQAHWPNRDKELIAFSEAAMQNGRSDGVFGGNQPKLYLPGKPPFERLAQQWVERAGHFIHDMRSDDNRTAEKVAREWCAAIPGASFDSFHFTPSQHPSFQGSIVVIAKASNGVDAYEKLLAGNVSTSKGHQALPAPNNGATIQRAEIKPSELIPTIQQAVARVVENDEDLQKFRGFYERKLCEELGKAGTDPQRRRQLESELSPVVFARIAAAKGVRYTSGQLAIRFGLDGFKYQSVLEIVPAVGQILIEPPSQACAETGRTVPVNCLAQCEVSKKMVLKHLLTTSEATGRKGLQKLAVKCPISGKRVFQDELARSPITGKVGAKHCFHKSDISDRLGLPEDFTRCDFSNASVLRDEVLESQVSGKLARKDEIEKSAVSGKVGHRSEFLRCNFTGQFLLPAEAGRSDLSNRVVRKDLLKRSEKPPFRWGAPDELVLCTASKRVLLKDEVGKSAVSGQIADKDLLVPSARSGALALKSELIPCAKSGALLLPSEVGVCALTGKTVDDRLLEKSAVSNTRALKDVLVTCAKTGARVLPSELASCEVSGAKVLPQFLAQCQLTQKRVLRDLLVSSAISGILFLRQHAVVSLESKRNGTSKEAVFCHWLNGPVLIDEAGKCSLTGLTFSRRFLNTNSELACLRELLDGHTHRARQSAHFAEWLLQQDPKTFDGLTETWVLESPSGAIQVTCGKIQHFFGFVVRYVGLVLKKDSRYLPLGRIVIGRRGNQGWVNER
jgi:superfamily II DNA or RNA helicase